VPGPWKIRRSAPATAKPTFTAFDPIVPDSTVVVAQENQGPSPGIDCVAAHRQT
jgi:hypothetical protein